MALTREAVLSALGSVQYPGFRRDVVSLGVVRELHVEGGLVRFEIDVAPGDPGVLEPIEQAARTALEALAGVERVQIRVWRPDGSPALRMAGASRPASTAAAGGLDTGLTPGVRHIVAVASGKGGVGKSTVAVNLAVALAHNGSRVGLLDADIYGPSIPLMTGIREQPRLTAERRLLPFERFGVKVMSLGFLVDPEQAVIWRGPMVMKAVEQLLGEVEWGDLDVLVVDMPPGTGDVQLTLSQKVRLAGAVIVTTPQDVALADAIKGVSMFRKVEVPVLGLVENMSFFQCPHCSERSEIFGHGGGREEASRLGVECLAEIPLDAEIRAGGDEGRPVVERSPDSPRSKAFLELARRVHDSLERQETPTGGVFERFKKVWRSDR